MATYRDAAIAAYQDTRADWVTAGKEKLRPLMTDENGTQVLDPIGKTEVAHEDRDAGLLILHTVDGSDLYFAVYPKRTEDVRMVTPKGDGTWTRGATVADLDDVGRALVEGVA